MIIGTLKAIGYGNGQVFWHFAKFGTAMGLGGGIVGLVLGYLMSMFVISLYRMFYEFPDLSNHIYPGTYLGGITISLLWRRCSDRFKSARSALSLKPAEAMRPKPPAQGAVRSGWNIFKPSGDT